MLLFYLLIYEETVMEKISNLTNIAQLTPGRARIRTQAEMFFFLNHFTRHIGKTS